MVRTTILVLTFLAFLAVGGYVWFRSQVRTGIPSYIPLRQCQTEMRQIDGAKAMWAADHHKTTNDTPTWNDLVGADRYLRSQPQCGTRGTYKLGRVGQLQKCSIPEHNVTQ
jgi:hypothetical protein